MTHHTRDHDPTGRNGWLLHPPDPDAPTRLFCFPYLGAGASLYHRWPRRFGSTEVCLIQPPGRDNRLVEPPYRDYPALAADLVTYLRPYLDRPYGLFAHCNSVFAAFVTVRRLAGVGAPPPVRFFASSMVAPHQVPFGSVLDIPVDRLDRVVAQVMRARGVEPTPELVELSLDAMVADVQAYRDFPGAPPGPMPCPVTVLAWQDDKEVPPGLTTGWTEHGECRRVILDGDHWSFLRAPPQLLAEIGVDLAAGSRRS